MYLPLVFVLIGLIWERQISNILKRVLGTRVFMPEGVRGGRVLLAQLRVFFSSQVGDKKLPEYKFFSEFCEQLRTYQLQYGVSSSVILGLLRPWLIKDLQFEERSQGLFKRSLTQFFVISSFTWLFYYSARESLETKLSWQGFTLLQVVGVILFTGFFTYKKRIWFFSLEELSKRTLLFKSLKRVGLPISDVLLISKADQELLAKEKAVREHGLILMNYANAWRREGSDIESELIDLLNEISFLRSEMMERFESYFLAVRFLFLLIFYLSGYLLVVLGLIRQLALSY